MKKIFIILISLLMMMAVVSCSSGTITGTGDENKYDVVFENAKKDMNVSTTFNQL